MPARSSCCSELPSTSSREASSSPARTMRPEAPQSILNAIPGNPALSHLPGSLRATWRIVDALPDGTEKPRRASGTMRTDRFRSPACRPDGQCARKARPCRCGRDDRESGTATAPCRPATLTLARGCATGTDGRTGKPPAREPADRDAVQAGDRAPSRIGSRVRADVRGCAGMRVSTLKICGNECWNGIFRKIRFPL